MKSNNDVNADFNGHAASRETFYGFSFVNLPDTFIMIHMKCQAYWFYRLFQHKFFLWVPPFYNFLCNILVVTVKARNFKQLTISLRCMFDRNILTMTVFSWNDSDVKSNL